MLISNCAWKANMQTTCNWWICWLPGPSLKVKSVTKPPVWNWMEVFGMSSFWRKKQLSRLNKKGFFCLHQFANAKKNISTFGMDDIPCVLKPREAAKPKKSTPRNSQFFAPGQGLCSPSNQKTIRYYSQHLFSGANKNRVFNRGVFHPLLPFLKEIANLWTKCDNNRAQYFISLYNCMDITAWIYPLDFHSIETTLQRFVGNTAGPIQLNGCFRDPRILGCFLHGVIIIIR